MKKNFGGLNSFWPHWNFSLVLALVLVGLTFFVGQPAVTAQDTIDFNQIARATVYLSSVYQAPGGPAVSCVGSGTIVSTDGLILTNAHAVVDGARCRVEDITVSLTVRPGEPPVPSYYADVISFDMGADLAVLRITRVIDGRLAEADTLSLPFIELGDSRNLRLDDTITVFGYEGIGEDTVTLSRGTIIGFLAEPQGGSRAWLKTSATILGTMSGGGAYDAQGRLIGIPTTAPVSAQEDVLDCRRVQDTNGDNQVDSRDACIPMGGFINSLRPVHMAEGLVRAAQLGITDDGHIASPAVQAALLRGSGAPEFGPIRFSPTVNEAGLPTMFVTQLPAGASSLFLFFDYHNMRPGMTYELRTTRDGASTSTFSLSPALWGGQTEGGWYIGSADQVWPNGVYEFALFLQGRAVQTARLTIGGPPQIEPAFSDIVFGLLDLQGNVIGSGYVLGVGNVVTARFIYREMTDGMPWTAVWFYDGEEFQREDQVWSNGPSGSLNISIAGELLPGTYGLELWIGDRIVTSSRLIMAGGRDGAFARVFSNPRFADGLEGGMPSGVIADNFTNRPPELYAFVDWQLLGGGSPWTYRWRVDGDVFFEGVEHWAASDTGSDFWFRLSSADLLPDGAYTLEILLGGQLFVAETARVGLGQLPVTSGNEAIGVRTSGVIVDAQTGEPISKALFIVLDAEYSVVDFVWDEAQVFGMSQTDSQGYFEIDRLLPYGEFYSVVIVKDGYLPVSADGIELDPENPEFQDGQLEFRLEMNRDLIR